MIDEYEFGGAEIPQNYIEAFEELCQKPRIDAVRRFGDRRASAGFVLRSRELKLDAAA